MEAVFERITNKPLRGRIAEKIQQAIFSGDLKEGQRLVERHLADQFATSLTSVREALIELERDGFVTKKPNSATYVTKFSHETAEKNFAFRRVLEGYAIEQACLWATTDDIEQMEKVYLELVDAARQHDNQLFIRTDFLLHQTFWRMAHNDYVVEALRKALIPYFAFSAIRLMSRERFDLLQDAASHLPIIEAIRSKNPELARRAFLVALEGWKADPKTFLGDEVEHRE
jgi:DNA-binding GntR family transcriptional regulator